jgi:cytochrome P450 family 109
MNTEMPQGVTRNILLSELDPSIESQIAWFHRMQETQPIRYRPEHNLWELFRYKDIQQVLLDHATFSISGALPESFPCTLAKSDPPEHRLLRGLVSKAFTPRRVEELTPYLIQSVDELLKPAIDRGRMNLATELTFLLPIRVITKMLGLPAEDRDRALQWSYQMMAQALGLWISDNDEIVQYFSDLLNERKLSPSNDLISGLLAAEENGVHLTYQQIVYMCMELMTAGNVTTTVMLNAALYRLCQHPKIYQDLRNDPSLIPGAIEEVLRYDFPPNLLWRTARHDTVFNGHQIKAGQHVVAWAGAANCDETYFPHSEQFDIRRSPNPHLNFSHGIHGCLGSSLARLEGRILLERITAHFSEIRLDPDNPVQYMAHMGSLKVIQSLDVLFTPAGLSAS